MDYLLDENGDISIGENGDVVLTDSVKQAVQIRLRWIFGEWRFHPEYGIPYFEEFLIKNPNPLRMKQLIRDAVMEVDQVMDVKDIQIFYDKANRRAKISLIITTTEKTYREEVEIHA